MPAEYKSYFLPVPGFLLMTQRAYELINDQIESAVVGCERDLIALSFSRHRKVDDHVLIIRNGNEVNERESCHSCSNVCGR